MPADVEQFTLRIFGLVSSHIESTALHSDLPYTYCAIDGVPHEAAHLVAGCGLLHIVLVAGDGAVTRRAPGRTKLKVETDAARGPVWHELQIRIRHPNYFGMQIETKTSMDERAELGGGKLRDLAPPIMGASVRGAEQNSR